MPARCMEWAPTRGAPTNFIIKKTMDMKRILITRTDRLGDVVLSTPIIRAVRKTYPDAYIAFMVRPENKDVIINNPDLNEIILYDKYGKHKSFLSTYLFASEIKKKEFDTAVALHPTNRAHTIFFLAGIPNRIGYNRKLSFLLSKVVPHLKQFGNKHESEYNFDLFRESGIKLKDDSRIPYMYSSDEDKERIDDFIKTRGIEGDFICIHAGASCLSKKWDARRFSETADILKEKYKSNIVLVGGEETLSISEEIMTASKKEIIDLTGALSIGELAELISRSRLFISNDSGPVHVAVAVGTPVISIFGRKSPGLSPKRWGPLGYRDISLHKDVGCDECKAHECEIGFKCLKAVTVEDILLAAEKILS